MKIFFLSFFLLFFLACQENEVPLKSIFGQEELLIKSEKGYKVKSSSLLIFDIFSLSCSACKEEAKEITNFYFAHKDEVQIIALPYEKNLSQESLKDFAKAYNAYYFINSGESSKLIKEILKKIAYEESLAFPLKIIFKNGEYKTYILGEVKKETLEEILNNES